MRAATMPSSGGAEEDDHRRGLEWVEIIEPSSRNIMYANLTTGQCVWEPPSGTHVKKFDENQWWELFDSNTSRFYYYNATSQKTVWHRPQNCDIIPLAKLQQIKQNTEVADSTEDSKKISRESVATQTSLPTKSASNGALPNASFFPLGIYNQSVGCTHWPTQHSCCPNRLPAHGPSYPLWSFQKDEVGYVRSGNRTAPHQTSSPSPRLSRKHFHHTPTSTGSFLGQQHLHGNACSCHFHGDSGGRRMRRTSQSSQSSSISCNRPYRESGRSSDSSVSHSRTSLESSNYRVLESRKCSGRDCRRTHGSSRSIENSKNSVTLSPPESTVGSCLSSPTHSQRITSPSTPVSHRRTNSSTRHKCHRHHEGCYLHIAKQKSFDVQNCHKDANFDRPKDMPLSRSYSFMSRPRCHDDDEMHERFLAGGMRSIESTPQSCRRQKVLQAIPGSPDVIVMPSHKQRLEGNGVESFATPMMHRKQRSLESGKNSFRMELRPSNNVSTQLTTSDSSPSPPSPHRRFSPFHFEFSRCPDSGTSTLTDKDTKSHCGRGSADSSPHSQVDSGLVSGTTGSRGSVDSSSKRHADSCHVLAEHDNVIIRNTSIDRYSVVRKCPHRKHNCGKVKSNGISNVVGTDSDKSDTLQSNSSSQNFIPSGIAQPHSSSGSSTARQNSPGNTSRQVSPSSGAQSSQQQPFGVSRQDTSPVHKDLTHLYSNLEYVYDQPVYQYIMEHAKMTGFRIGDAPFDDGDSLHSEDSDGHRSDSDEFADDEGMSNADSSSQECLDDYLQDNETYTQFFRPASKNSAEVPDGHQDRPVKSLVPSMASLAIAGSAPPAEPAPVVPKSVGPPPMELHSLRRRREAAPPVPILCSPPRDRSDASSKFARQPPSEGEFDTSPNLMENYAKENLNVHTRGLLRKKVPFIDMISWTQEPIRKPMLATTDKTVKGQACEMFKLVQIYMSDRKPKPEMTLNSVGLDIILMAFNNFALRDELFVQICRQTTENHKRDSLRRGWELLAICLEFFPPSEKFSPYLSGYIVKHSDPHYGAMFPDVSKWPIHIQVAHYAAVCCKRLERTTVNAKRQRLKKPTLEEIDLARLHIFRASMFGSTLEEVMALQRDRYPHRRLPWVQTALSEEVLRLQGTKTEGIFRVPADFDEVHQLKQVVDQWETGECSDPHVLAALLKLWYRELYTPVIPDDLYNAAIGVHDDPVRAVVLVNQLPEINRLVLAYLVRFLQYFAQPDVVSATKMDANNLAMVMAPNCLRCTSDDPRVIYENTRKEMAFIRTLIQHLDTSFMEGVV